MASVASAKKVEAVSKILAGSIARTWVCRIGFATMDCRGANASALPKRVMSRRLILAPSIVESLPEILFVRYFVYDGFSFNFSSTISGENNLRNNVA